MCSKEDARKYWCTTPIDVTLFVYPMGPTHLLFEPLQEEKCFFPIATLIAKVDRNRNGVAIQIQFRVSVRLTASRFCWSQHSQVVQFVTLMVKLTKSKKKMLSCCIGSRSIRRN